MALLDISDEFIHPVLPCIRLLERCNFQIFDKENSFWRKYWRSFFILPCMVMYQISLTMYLKNMFEVKVDLVELAFVISVYVVCTQTLFKIWIVVSNKEKIKTIILQLGQMWRTEDLTEVQINKKNVLLKRLKLCYTVTEFCIKRNAAEGKDPNLWAKNGWIDMFCYWHAVFYWINMIGSWQYILAPLLETLFRRYILQQECEFLLPFSCSFPFDPTGSWAIYIAVYTFETYSMFRIIYSYIGTEFLMITLCSHLASEFSLLQEDLLNIKPGGNKDFEDLVIVVKRHQKLLVLTKQLNEVFNKMIFVNLLSANISICFFAFSAKVAQGAFDMANNFVPVIALILPIFNLCYYSEALSEASSSMADSAYINLWYNGNTCYQKLMWFILTRSQLPCTLTSLNNEPIALHTFSKVLSTTWSYFSLASSLYEGES